MSDRRGDSDDRRFEERLRAVAAEIAEEPLPDGILEVAADEGRNRWRGPILLAASLGLAAAVIWLAVVQTRPPDVAHQTPSPTASASPPASISPTPTQAPTFSPSPTPVPVTPAAEVVAGGSMCGDGIGGFSFMVPEGWFTNRAFRGAAACRFISDALNADGRLPEPAPIRAIVTDRELPRGQATELEAGVATATADRFATRYRVIRSLEILVVTVVPLLAEVDGTNAYLHIEADEADAGALAAVTAIIDRLEVLEPLATSEDALAAADALYAAQEPATCLTVEGGFLITYPGAWWTNPPVGDVPGCTYLAPSAVDIPADSTGVLDGAAITISMFEGDVAFFEDRVGYESIRIDRWPGVRIAWAGGSYWYIVQLGAMAETGPTLVLATDDDPINRAVLDRVTATIRISPAPAEVVERDPLPSCGVEVRPRLAEGTPNAEARTCFVDAYRAGEPAEFVTLGATLEGTTILSIFRVIGPDEVELIADATHDLGGATWWDLYRCTRLDVWSNAEGAPEFGPLACDSPTQLPVGSG